MEIDRGLMEKAVRVFGAEAQIDLIIEECAELIQAINHFRRKRVGEDKVAEEIADVMIMCEQMRYIIDPAIINEYLKRKSVKLDCRLSLRDKVAGLTIDETVASIPEEDLETYRVNVAQVTTKTLGHYLAVRQDPTATEIDREKYQKIYLDALDMLALVEGRVKEIHMRKVQESLAAAEIASINDHNREVIENEGSGKKE